jgi:uncharacterized delta-60 repeat protein
MAKPSGAQVPLTLDTSFRCTRFLNLGLHDVLPLADGTVLASGFGVSIDNCCALPPHSFFRLYANGDIDEEWSTNLGYGSILASGDYYYLTIDGFPVRYFRTTGAIDQSFQPLVENDAHPGLLNGNGGDVYVQPDGKVLCTGDHHVAEQWGINAPGWYSLLRVDTNGILDSTYQWRKTDGVIWTIRPTTQGRFLLSGVYNTYEGQPEGRILRIWPDGSLDSTFHTEIIKGYATCLKEQPNGRILAGGQFVFPNDPDTLHLIRLMPDGTLDTNFNNHTEYGHVPHLSFGDFGFSVNALVPLGDGRFIAGGDFTQIDGQLRRGIALLDSTGHLLNTALYGEGALLTHDFNSNHMYSQVNAIRQAPDGSIFLAGAFKGFDDGILRDTTMTFIAKLHGLSTGVQEIAKPVWQVQLWPNPGTDVLQIEATVKGRMEVLVRDATGRAVLVATSPNGSLEMSSIGISPGVYLLEVNTADGRRTVKWVKR